MQTHTHVTYSFDELSDDAKQNALKSIREKYHDLYSWHDDNIESLKAFLACFDITKFNYSVSTYGYSYATIKIDNIPDWEYWEEFADVREFVLSRVPDKSKACPFTGYCMDETLLKQVREFLDNPEDKRTLYELLNDCLSDWVSDYVADWEYTYSDESLAEMAEMNEWEFDENGELH